MIHPTHTPQGVAVPNTKRPEIFKTSEMKRMEKLIGKDIDQIINESLDRTGTLEKTAEDLGIAASTLSIWLVRLRLKTKTILVPIDK